MWKSLVYKEWIKIKWFVIVFGVILLLSVGNIFLKVQHDFAFEKAENYWYIVLFKGYSFFNYGLFKFIPILGALTIAVAQYFPETVNKRIKLTFHLPLKENRSLLIMMLFGMFCLCVLFAVALCVFLILSSIYFPAEIIYCSFISILPWFLSGFIVYFFIALIVLEPTWKYRFLYLLVAVSFVPVYLESALPGGYAPVMPLLILFVILLGPILLFSGYRFRKGEM